MKVHRSLVSLILAGGILSLASAASAHVVVYPKETLTGAYEKYTVRVPVEKDTNTTKLRIEFPAGLKVSTVKPMTGWTYSFEQDSQGRNIAVTWTATAGGIKPHEFMEFEFVGANPKETGTLTWKAYQTYADNEVVEWTGAPDSKTPASTTVINQGPAGHSHADDGHEDVHAAPAAPAATPATPAAPTATGNTLPLLLSGLALLLSIISLFRKKA